MYPKFPKRQLSDEDIASVCHEANRALCEAQGDYTHRPWDVVSDAHKGSLVAGVRLARQGTLPEALHESWCKQKFTEGWVYGPVKDVDQKTHPCLVAYDNLPLSQRVKDALFQKIVLTLTNHI